MLKEVIEILFQEGLIKVRWLSQSFSRTTSDRTQCLFATETFSIGLNMRVAAFPCVILVLIVARRPAKTVVFTNVSIRMLALFD